MNLQSTYVLSQRPLYMFGNEFGLRVLARFERSNYAWGRRRIAKRNRKSTLLTLVPDSADGAAFGFFQPGLFAPCKQVD